MRSGQMLHPAAEVLQEAMHLLLTFLLLLFEDAC
jgi:hypothetical protein